MGCLATRWRSLDRHRALDALPCRTLLTRDAFVVVGLGMRQTLASYLSMHPVPDTTASTGHFVSGRLGGPAAPVAPASSTSAAVTVICFLNEIMGARVFLP